MIHTDTNVLTYTYVNGEVTVTSSRSPGRRTCLFFLFLKVESSSKLRPYFKKNGAKLFKFNMH